MSASMAHIDADSISIVTDALDPEREALLELLSGLEPDDWHRPTECPAYSVQGIATHILGDDLSLLSRQRDGAVQGLVLVAERMPGVDFRTLLDTFNDQWVDAARFLSPPLLIELLRFSGTTSSEYYRSVDPTSPCEPVPLFGPAPGESSPFWQAIAREYLERWAHHSQIRRALGLPSLADAPFLEVGAQIVATVARMPLTTPHGSELQWTIGPIEFGDSQRAADLLTLAHTEDEIRDLAGGPSELVALFAARLGRQSSN